MYEIDYILKFIKIYIYRERIRRNVESCVS